MVAIHPRVFIGDLQSCRSGTDSLAVLHACKSPCHQRAVGYTRSLASDHPEYLARATAFELYLNLIDPPLPLFQLASFEHLFRFADEHLATRPLLIHCNQGESRAPSLALLLLAKRLGVLPDDSYSAAREAFTALYERYRPGVGIAQFLAEHWHALGRQA